MTILLTLLACKPNKDENNSAADPLLQADPAITRIVNSNNLSIPNSGEYNDEDIPLVSKLANELVGSYTNSYGNHPVTQYALFGDIPTDDGYTSQVGIVFLVSTDDADASEAMLEYFASQTLEGFYQNGQLGNFKTNGITAGFVVSKNEGGVINGMSSDIIVQTPEKYIEVSTYYYYDVTRLSVLRDDGENVLEYSEDLVTLREDEETIATHQEQSLNWVESASKEPSSFTLESGSFE